MAITPLAIKSKEKLGGNLKNWNGTENIDNIVRTIEGITVNQDDDSAVSGIPTPFAREHMFKSALMMTSENVEANSLNAYYLKLRSEWRGVVAAIALGYASFKVRRVNLEYSATNQGEGQNLYEPKGAFGEMLFERKDMWCDDEQAQHPYICTIKFGDELIGGTSPETLFFTSSSYNVVRKNEEPYINDKGKFVDPNLANFTDGDLLTLYAYVRHLENQSRIKHLDYVADVLSEWGKAIGAFIASKSLDVNEAKIPPVNLFAESKLFHEILDFQEELFGANGWVYTRDQVEEVDGVWFVREEQETAKDMSERTKAVPFDPHSLLLPSDCRIARVILNDIDGDDTSKLPVMVLKAEKKPRGGCAFFALPLTGLGLSIFGQDSLKYILNTTNKANGSTLIAEYNENDSKLKVTLNLTLRKGGTYGVNEEYKITDCIDEKNLLIWPNFITPQWQRYFFYSELPSTSNRGFKAMPFLCTPDLKVLQAADHEPLNLLTCEEIAKNYECKGVEGVASLKRAISTSASANQTYGYEVYESNIPYGGVMLSTIDGKSAGLLMVNYTKSDSDDSTTLPRVLTTNKTLSGTNVGVDFGSTNTSIAYLDNRNPTGLQFKNRVVSLFQSKAPKGDELATEERLFFFQQTTIQSNAIKSVLTLHDDSLVPDRQDRGKDVTGGFPCFNQNLPIDSVNDNFIELRTQKSGEKIDVVHNMKWKRDDSDNNYKQALLKGIMLHVYAELFIKGLYPKVVKWSYPSAMGAGMIGIYARVWDSLRAAGYNPLSNSDYKINIARIPEIKVDDDAPKKDNGGAAGGNVPNSDDLLAMLLGGAPATPKKEEAAPVEKEEDKGGFRKDDDDKPHSLNLEEIAGDDVALTEAYAVANYLANTGIPGVSLASKENLVICFDIGGSTTDVSVLWGTDEGADTVGVIKQNSIRFAAQLVSEAAGRSPRFKEVLDAVCDEFKLSIEGLKPGSKNRYNKDTAAYYFNQVVDRLSPEQLPFFYREIEVKCPELMVVNLYVTSLIMVYAGVLMRKIAKRLRSSKEYYLRPNDPKFSIAVTFAGKGARLFDWLGAVRDVNTANNIYKAMFNLGLGATDWQDFYERLNITISDKAVDDVKYEVSKGLAYDYFTPKHPHGGEDLEVLGEEGFWITDDNGDRIALDLDNSITAEWMEQIGSRRFGCSNKGTGMKFRLFMALFTKLANTYFNAGLRNVDEIQNNMDVLSYIHTSEAFQMARQKARGEEKFDYVEPILIIEGMQFYNQMFRDK